MKHAITKGTLGLAVLVSAICAPAAAQDAGWYAGLNAGQSRAKIDDQRIADSLLGAGFATTSITDDDRDAGGKFFGGYQFNRYFSVEGGYFDLGKFGFVANTLPLGALSGRIKVRGLNLDLVGRMPITNKFAAFARVGMNHAEARDTFAGTGSVYARNLNPSKRDSNLKYGLGLEYAFNEALALRGEAERYRINDAVGNKGDIDLVSLGLIYRFDRNRPQPAARTMAPEPVRETVAAAPAPVVVATAPSAPAPVAPPPRFEKVTLSATELFAFDKSVLRTPQPKLDEIARALSTHPEIGEVMITGYADRIGSRAYNQKLSERRANAVKEYLVSHSVEAKRLKAVGKSEENPVVVCTNKSRPALIECLAPNRRVEVEQITIVLRVP